MTRKDPTFHLLAQFVQERIREGRSLPTLSLAAQQIHQLATDHWRDAGYVPDYAGGYADGAEDALRAISGVWRYHPDYGGWADDE